MLTEQTVYIMKKRSCGEDLNAPGEKTKKKKVPDFSRTFLGWWSQDLPEMMVLPENGFAILLEEEFFSSFAKKLKTTEGIKAIFFVTDSEDAFREMTTNIGINETYQLYRDYIENFVIGGRR